jgi:hypothetical protein
MKAITVWAPWSSLIAFGFKPYEFRGWPAPRGLVGRRIAIHAGARPVRITEVRAILWRLGKNGVRGEARPFLERLVHDPSLAPLSHIVCTAELGEPVRANKVTSEFGAVMNDSDRDETFNWAWPMLAVEELRPPSPARGAQGLWNWSP